MLKKLLVSAIVLISSKTFSQTPEDFLEKLKVNYVQEKVYIHYDKQSYIAGESIWFKAYLMEGFLPSSHSTAIAIELLSDSGKVLQKKYWQLVEACQ